MAEIRRSPVDMENLPLFTGFYTSQVVIAGFLNHQQYVIDSLLGSSSTSHVFVWCQNSCWGRITRPCAIATHQQVLGQSLGFTRSGPTRFTRFGALQVGASYVCWVGTIFWWIRSHGFITIKNQPFGGNIFWTFSIFVAKPRMERPRNRFGAVEPEKLIPCLRWILHNFYRTWQKTLNFHSPDPKNKRVPGERPFFCEIPLVSWLPESIPPLRNYHSGK